MTLPVRVPAVTGNKMDRVQATVNSMAAMKSALSFFVLRKCCYLRSQSHDLTEFWVTSVQDLFFLSEFTTDVFCPVLT